MAEFGGMGRRQRLRASLASLGCAAALAISGSSITSAVLAPGATAAPAAPAAVTGGPNCPQVEGNARFVRYVYFSILERCPEAGGLQYWTTALNNGLNRAVFTDLIDMSDENIVDHNVVPLYGGLIGRGPTADEVKFWSTYIRSNKADDALIAFLASSDEFWNQIDAAPEDKTYAWLEQAYQGILDRAPDDAGMAYFSSVLGPNPTAAQRHDVAFNSLERSDENTRSWVVAVYYAALNRPPDAGGAQYWFTWLQGTHQTFRMWTYFLASQEAYDLAQTQPNFSSESLARTGSSRLLQAKKAHSAG